MSTTAPEEGVAPATTQPDAPAAPVPAAAGPADAQPSDAVPEQGSEQTSAPPPPRAPEPAAVPAPSPAPPAPSIPPAEPAPPVVSVPQSDATKPGPSELEAPAPAPSPSLAPTPAAEAKADPPATNGDSTVAPRQGPASQPFSSRYDLGKPLGSGPPFTSSLGGSTTSSTVPGRSPFGPSFGWTQNQRGPGVGGYRSYYDGFNPEAEKERQAAAQKAAAAAAAGSQSPADGASGTTAPARNGTSATSNASTPTQARPSVAQSTQSKNYLRFPGQNPPSIPIPNIPDHSHRHQPASVHQPQAPSSSSFGSSAQATNGHVRREPDGGLPGSPDRHKRRRSDVGLPSPGGTFLERERERAAKAAKPPPPPPVAPFNYTQLRKSEVRPPLVKVDNGAVVAALSELEKTKEGIPLLGRVVYDGRVEPAKLLDGGLLAKGVGGVVEVTIDADWLDGCEWDVGEPEKYEGAPVGGRDGDELRIPAKMWELEGLAKRKVWGTDVYTDDSDVLGMCLHSGWLRVTPVGEGKKAKKVGTLVVELRVVPTLVRYQGSSRQGLRSRSWGNGHDGVSLSVKTVKSLETSVQPHGRRWLKIRAGEVARRLNRFAKEPSVSLSFPPVSEPSVSSSEGDDKILRVVDTFVLGVAKGESAFVEESGSGLVDVLEDDDAMEVEEDV